MIAYIEGELVQKEPTYTVIDVGGIGYHVNVSLNTSAAIGDLGRCKLFTYLQIREDAHTLYGFKNLEEKRLFIDLISVSGIGANTAMIILSSLATEEITQAILSEDVKTIRGIKGIGNKTAQRLILELKDKLSKDAPEALPTDTQSPLSERQHKRKIKQEAILALTALGIAKTVAEKNVDTIIQKKDSTLSVEELIKLALKI